VAQDFELVVEDDDGNESVMALSLGEASIGRQEGSQIRLNERNVSRQHARLLWREPGVFAQDLDSYNGVFINDRRVSEEGRLYAGDVLRVGDFLLRLKGALGERPKEDDYSEATTGEQELPPLAVIVGADEPTSVIRPDTQLPVPAQRQVVGGEHARLVCISTALTGQVFEIGANEVVLGRTGDNQVVLNHRSVSRHHCKVVIGPDGTHTLVDLESANGTLVNGEEYARTALKEGDVIEVGHVKLRYVPPGGTYTEARVPDAENPATGRPPRRRLGLRPLLLLLFVLAAALALYQLRGGSTDAALLHPVERLVQPSGPAEMDPLRAAAAHMTEERWGEALATLAGVDGEAAALLRTRAERERSAQAALLRADGALALAHWGEAWNALSDIGDESVYFPRVGDRRARARVGLLSERLHDFREAVAAGQRLTASEILGEIESLEPEPGQIDKLRAELRVLGATAVKKAPLARRATKSADEIFEEGRVALASGDREGAIAILSRCVRADRKHCLCHKALGIALVKEGQMPRAARHYEQYVTNCPESPDAADVRRMLERYQGRGE
jgi:pSer/pThr/pTyr-binding forkhead associated (FHA) protein/tetratricopeptide (TPR) repeat protein